MECIRHPRKRLRTKLAEVTKWTFKNEAHEWWALWAIASQLQQQQQFTFHCCHKWSHCDFKMVLLTLNAISLSFDRQINLIWWWWLKLIEMASFTMAEVIEKAPKHWFALLCFIIICVQIYIFWKVIPAHYNSYILLSVAFFASCSVYLSHSKWAMKNETKKKTIGRATKDEEDKIECMNYEWVWQWA